MAETMIN